jgi:hypothetical protein
LKSATQGTMPKEQEDDIKNIRGCFSFASQDG